MKGSIKWFMLSHMSIKDLLALNNNVFSHLSFCQNLFLALKCIFNQLFRFIAAESVSKGSKSYGYMELYCS